MSVIDPSSGDTTPNSGAVVSGRGNRPTGRRQPAGLPVRLDVAGVPVTRERVRNTRRWMLLLLLAPLCLFGISVLALGTGGPPEPVVHPRATPPNYQAITDAYFGYAAPSGYRQNPTWTDANGDFLYGTPAAFVAETEVILDRSPTAASAPPPSFRSFGEPKLTGYTTGPPHRITMPGTRVAFEEHVSRGSTWEATAIDAWEPQTTTQVWLLVHAPPSVTRNVIASFQG